jgi:hypothetical protein
MVLQNVSSSMNGLDTVASVSPIAGWMITFGIFIGVLVTIFLLSKNFRQFMYGAFISTVVLINFKFSRWVGKSAFESNFEPLKWVGYIAGFIILSIGLGHIFLRTKWGKNLEKKIK